MRSATYLPEVWREDEAARAAAFLERVCAPRGADRGAVDGRRLRPRRAQHRQHQHHRRELRLRPVALPADLRSRLHRRLLRRERALRLRPTAGDAAVEPDPARRVPAAACAAGRAGGGAGSYRAGVPARARRRRCCARLGLRSGGAAADGALVERCSTFLERTQAPSSRPSSIGAAASRARSAPPAARPRRSTPVAGVRAGARRRWRRSSRQETRPRPPLLRRRRHPARC